MASGFATPMGARSTTPAARMIADGNGDAVMGRSAPPGAGGGGTMMRQNTPRRRLHSPGAEGRSPKAKPPASYRTPGQTPQSPPLDGQTLTNELAQIKLAVQAQHDWLNSVAEAVVDQAGALDSVASGEVLMKGKLAFMERELEKGLSNCEKNLTDAFSKVDALIG